MKRKVAQKRVIVRANASLAFFLTKSLLIVAISLTFGWYFIPEFIGWILARRISISPERSPEFYEIWLQPPIPIYFNVTMFNVTNPDEIEVGMLPRFTEVGPYVFHQIKTKVNISLDDPSDTATYTEHVSFHFRQELSGNRSLNDVITMINLPFAAAAIQIEREIPWPISHIAHMILLNYKEPLFIQRTVEEALFKGWRVPFMEQIEEEIGLSLLKNNTFGFFVDMNDTMNGPYTIQRAVYGDKALLGNIIKYRNEPQLPFWGDQNSTCNKFKGTDAYIFPPFANKDVKCPVFMSDFCGSLNLAYQNEVVIEGITGYHYSIPQDELLGPRERSDRRCFCKNIDSKPEACLKRGTIDLGPCRDNAPVALSLPHFLDADPVYLEDIAEGIKPDREKHETFIEIEPLTGIVLQARKRVQLNLILQQVSSIPALSRVKDMLFPCLWGVEGATFDKPTSSRLSNILLLIKFGENFSKYFTLFIAVIIPALMLRKLMVPEVSIDKTSTCAITNGKTCLDGSTGEDEEFLKDENDH